MIEDFYKKTIIRNLSEIDFNGEDYVDLELPSGTLWSTKNIGASNIKELGYKFFNGSILPEETSPVNNKLLEQYIRKEIEYPKSLDPANYHLGGSWKLPGKENFEELNLFTKKDTIQLGGSSYIKFSSLINPNNYILFKQYIDHLKNIPRYLTKSFMYDPDDDLSYLVLQSIYSDYFYPEYDYQLNYRGFVRGII